MSAPDLISIRTFERVSAEERARRDKFALLSEANEVAEAHVLEWARVVIRHGAKPGDYAFIQFKFAVEAHERVRRNLAAFLDPNPPPTSIF